MAIRFKTRRGLKRVHATLPYPGTDMGIGGGPDPLSGVGGKAPGGPEGPRETGPGSRAGPEGGAKGPSAPDRPVRAAVSGAVPPRSPESINLLLTTLKLPLGSWSASLLSFAKFFSLPLDGAFVGKIRQEVLRAEQARSPTGEAAPPAGEGGDGAEAPVREALSLAALAAAAKGVELLPEALAEYAGALLRGRKRGESSPRGEGADSGAGDGDSRDSGENPGAEAGRGGIPGKDAGGREAKGPAGGGEPEGESGEGPGKGGAAGPGRAFRKRVLAAQGPLLGLLNKLPGKGGTRWVVLPFSMDNGLAGCLRILLKSPGGTPAEAAGQMAAERMGLDITNGEESWSFTLRAGAARQSPARNPAGAPAARQSPARPLLSLEMSRRPAFRPGEGESLKRELAELLELAPEKLRTGGEFPPLAEDSRDWTLPSLDKEV